MAGVFRCYREAMTRMAMFGAERKSASCATSIDGGARVPPRHHLTLQYPLLHLTYIKRTGCESAQGSMIFTPIYMLYVISTAYRLMK
jgi:hypothetical protein